jgi:putative hydrolase of the HAD superfamily
MKHAAAITCLFLDIGGVVLTGGWSRAARKRAVAYFKLDGTKLEARHQLTFDIHQAGKLTLNEYLDHVVFYEKRSFTRTQFQRFMFAQSHPFPEMLNLIARLKVQHGLKIIVVSNERRELNAYRIRKFKLNALADSFISSCFVHLLKPDADIFWLALDVAQVPARQVVYIENTPLFVEVAEALGIHSILHTDSATTCAKLASLGLKDNDQAPHATA